MWRHVAPLVAESGGRRCIALDLAGFGSSDLPVEGDYGIRSQYEHLELFIETLGLDRLTLVVNDLGSLLGLKYAVEHPDRIRGLVLIEAAFMPAEAWYGQLTIMQKMMFAMFRNQRRAEAWIVEKNMIPAMMMKMGVVRRLSPSELAPYLAPYATDIERRRVMLSGPGPATFPPRGKTRAEGDFAFELDAVARGLVTLNRKVPFLLVEASPGMITRAKAIGYARKHFPDLTRISVGRGRHFLAEDHPEKIGKGISEWLSSKRI
jgi:haloalkane dehalogenase